MSDQLNPVSAEPGIRVRSKSSGRVPSAPSSNFSGPLTLAVSDGKPSVPSPEASGAKTGGASHLGRAGDEPDHCHAHSGQAVTHSRAPRMTQEVHDAICREFANGVPSPVLAVIYGFHAGYIRALAGKAGIRVRPKHIPWTDEQRQAIAARLKAGATGAQIGEEYGLTRNAALGRISHDPMLKGLGNAPTVKRQRKGSFSTAELETIAKRMRAGEASDTIAADYGLTGKALRSRALRVPMLRNIGFRCRVKVSHRTGYAVGTRRHAPLAIVAAVDIADGVSLMDLKPSACKWPSSADPVVFCCKAKHEAGKPYCRNHLIRAYRCEVA